MKRLGIFIFALFAFGAASAQTNTFYRTYNLGGMQGGLGIVTMADGGFVGIGQHEGNGSAGECDIYAYRVDECGNLLWMELFGTGAQEGGKSVIQRRNGNLLLMGLYNGRGFLIELDIDGHKLWEKIYNNVAWTIAAAEDNNGNLYVSCLPPSGGDYILMGCDPVGNVLWSNRYSGLGHMPLSVSFLQRGRLLIASTYGISGGDFSLTETDLSGNIIWSKIYGGNGYTDSDHQSWGCKALIDRTGNSATVVSQSFIGGSDNILLAHVDLTDGSPIWGRLIGDGGSDQPRDIVETEAGYAILGNSTSYNVSAGAAQGVVATMSERDVLLLMTDSIGSIRWARTYGAEERDKGIGLKYNSDKSFLISAYTSSPYFGNADNSMDPLFIRTDSLGMVACQVYSPSVTSQSIILAANTAGNSSPYQVSGSVSNSTLGQYNPTDRYVCLSCTTDPVFVPSDTNVCVNDTVFFYNTTSVGLTCFQRWSLDGVQLDGSLDTISYSFDTPGIYPILLFSNCGANTDTFRMNIRVNPFPEPEFTVTGNCLNDTTRFFNASTIPSGYVATWSWQFSDNTTSSQPSPTHIYSRTGTYPVTLTAVSDQGCLKSDEDTVVIHPLPRPLFTAESACDKDSVMMLNGSTGDFPIVSNQWWFGDGTQSTDESPFHIYPSPGRYLIGLRATDMNGCKAFHYRNVDVFPLPSPGFDIVPPTCAYFSQAEFLNKSSNYVATFWDFGDGDSSLLQDVLHRFDTGGFYDVRLIVTSDKGCTDSLTVQLEVKDDYIFWIPNAFTPNGDGTNDIFKPLGQGIADFRMELFNRWGRIVFETDNIEKGWDGHIIDAIAPTDVYVYKMYTTDYCGEKHDYLGRVTLLY